jgi:hypothetical protein
MPVARHNLPIAPRPSHPITQDSRRSTPRHRAAHSPRNLNPALAGLIAERRPTPMPIADRADLLVVPMSGRIPLRGGAVASPGHAVAAVRCAWSVGLRALS